MSIVNSNSSVSIQFSCGPYWALLIYLHFLFSPNHCFRLVMRFEFTTSWLTLYHCVLGQVVSILSTLINFGKLINIKTITVMKV